MITMTRLLSILAVFTLSLCAADLTGKWSGTIQVKKDGDAKTEPALVILKQEGAVLTGSGGPHEGEQHAMRNGKVEGNKITFEIALGEGGDRVMRFNLTAAGDQIDGDVTAPNKGNGEPETARLSLKRVKAD
jgi:hypothetical protein